MVRHQKQAGRSVPSPMAQSPAPAAVRLQKVIAESGLTSRRKAEELIARGRVTVNGKVVRELGTKVDPQRDHVKVDGYHLKPVPPRALIMLNKPQGYLSSLMDPVGRPTVQDLLGGVRLRVFPVGRLDFDSEGLLLLTNDGDMAQALLHPRYHVSKSYLVKVKGQLTNEEIESLAQGVELEDGRTAPAIVKKVARAVQNSWLEVTIHEGRKHQVKRMLETVGHPVIRLRRTRLGPLILGDLPLGHYRYLTDLEANALRALVRKRKAVPGNGPAASGQRAAGNRGAARTKARPRRSSPSRSVPRSPSSVLRVARASPLAPRPFRRSAR